MTYPLPLHRRTLRPFASAVLLLLAWTATTGSSAAAFGPLPTIRIDGTGDGCPNERASEVEAHVVQAQDHSVCGAGIVLFGARIDLGGETCPQWRLTHPAHQECTGATLDGHRCVPAADLDVVMEACNCSRNVLPLLEIGFAGPNCKCRVVATAGHVEDFATVPCETPPTRGS